MVGVGDLSDATWGSTILELRGMRIVAACHYVGSGLAIARVVCRGCSVTSGRSGVIRYFGRRGAWWYGDGARQLFLGTSTILPPVVLLPLGALPVVL